MTAPDIASPATTAPVPNTARAAAEGLLRFVAVALVAFLTVVDLFATQAILPSLVAHYGVSPAAMGVAVNASTFGMAVSGLLVALVSRRLDRRRGTVAALALLSVPTALLAMAPDLASFTFLRVFQGLCMAAAFTLTLAYLGEHNTAKQAAGAFAAYITGNVASNLVGRLISAGVADHFGVAANFFLFAALNLAGAVLVWFTLKGCTPAAMTAGAGGRSTLTAWKAHFRNPALLRAFAVGFCILFAFIGTFTYVNFILVQPPIGLQMMQIGAVYLVFLPSILTTPLAGRAVNRFGTRPALMGGLTVALIGLPLMLSPSLPLLLAGLVLVGVGTFFAQATATGFVGRAASDDRAAASGIYLACYFLGGLVGSAVLGQAFVQFGWGATVAGVGVALLAGMALGLGMTIPPARATAP